MNIGLDNLINKRKAKNLVNFTGFPDAMQPNQYGSYGVDGTSDFRPGEMFSDLQNNIGLRNDRILQTINIVNTPDKLDAKTKAPLPAPVAVDKLKTAANAANPKFEGMGKIVGLTFGVLAIAAVASLIK